MQMQVNDITHVHQIGFKKQHILKFSNAGEHDIVI